ncbi:MAG: GGDEF domain-containing protein, partial [Acetatifactor sp.]|nr:GGDEF domain-containing protein [Acetatifactor sp.]
MEILRQLIHDSIFAMGVSLLLVIIGVCMIIYWLFLCRKTKVALELLYIGISAVLIGTWAFTEEDPVMLLFDNRVYASYITYILLMLIGVTFMFFLKHYIVKEGRYLHKFLILFAIGGMFLMMILQCLGIADFKETVWIIHIVLVGDLLYFLLGILDKMRKRRRRNHVGFNTAGLVVLVVAVGLELYAYYTQIANMQIFGMFGLLAYIILLGLEVASDAAERIAEMQKAEIYKELAEKDILTKCYNRNAYTEDIQKKAFGENVFVVMLDLNNLKVCNDTLGHMEGDRYLTDSADLIKRIFDNYGKVYRVGGDEFCIIMENSSEKEIRTLIQKLVQEEAAYNEHSQTVYMQIASGYARYDAEKDADLDKTR